MEEEVLRGVPTKRDRRPRTARLSAMAASIGGSVGAAVEPGDHGRVAVVEEQRGTNVETGDAGHLLIGELEVEDVDVLALTLRAYRLRYDDDAALGQPPEDDLTDGLTVCRSDLAEQRVGEEVVFAFGEWAPGFDLDTALAHQLLVGGALEERMRLDLVDRRDDLVVLDKVDEPVRVEVRHADGLGEP